MLVGRRESCDIVLRFANVSAHHCQLTLNGGYWYVKDLKSRNGVKVNGIRVTEKRLDPGDELAVAKQNTKSPIRRPSRGPSVRRQKKARSPRAFSPNRCWSARPGESARRPHPAPTEAGEQQTAGRQAGPTAKAGPISQSGPAAIQGSASADIIVEVKLI